jgi:hypothetical protein
VYDVSDTGTYTALGSYTVADTAQVMYTVLLNPVKNHNLSLKQAVGFGLASTNLNSGLGSNSASTGVFNNGSVYFNGVPQHTGLPTFGQGDVIDVAVVGTYFGPGWWYRVNGGDWNGDPVADPATNTGGLGQFVYDSSSPLYPAVSIVEVGGPGNSAFTIQDVPVYPVPAGLHFWALHRFRHHRYLLDYK